MRENWISQTLPRAYRLEIINLPEALKKRLGKEYNYAVKARITENKGVKNLAQVSSIHIKRNEEKIAWLKVVHGGGKVVALPESHGGGNVILPNIVTCGRRLHHLPELSDAEIEGIKHAFAECHVEG